MIVAHRTAADTDEHVVHAGRCLVHGLHPEVVTTGVITLRDDNAARVVAPPANLAAVAGAAGTLDDDQYFFTVLSVDAYGELSAEATEANATTNAGAGAGSAALSWDAAAHAASYRVYWGLATGVYEGYFTTTGTSYAFTTTAGDTNGDTPAGIPTSGTERTRIKSAIGLPQAGKDVGGALFANGLVVQLTVDTDLSLIAWEAL